MQSIDNDMRCDGTDAEFFPIFRADLAEVLDVLTHGLPEADIFFVSQWADVEAYSGVAFALNPAHLAGEGPCAVLDPDTMELDPAREAAFQVLVEDYFGVVEDVCADYPTCRTDGGAMQTMDLVAEDMTHLSVQGHAKMAGMVFDALNESAD